MKDARLLLVTDPRPDLVDRVEAAVRGGVDIVQLRDKRSVRGDLIPLAEELKEACGRTGALFTVNDDVELARLVGADGVHLGEDDAPTPRARGVLGPGVVVGRSAGSVDVALEAVRGGADYLGVGTVFATPTKPDGEVAGLALIRALAREDLPVPWFAIGGVTLETAPAVAAAGAPGFAVVRAVLDAEDPGAAALELRAVLE
ncbi:MAG: Thiamin-phosphate pyrophosphorylase [uncultured Rubrobacteraceae bacterium]|uniref:Thiamine-phosphate synthase n=1 Tax=uncultured Rubrobacteraceae bacterium TaxID=349277 RepID=A0A6J4TDT6_9ACTN|nr:MAG: Thiamin-phosphate pyrophosphorylase [uncultured Rubrobacteraceae bacterium]